MVASEPITGSASEWVAVPRNHGLVVTRDADGDMSVLHVPMALAPPGPRMDTVVRCLRTLPLEGATPSGAGPAAERAACGVGGMQRCCRLV